MDSVGVEALQEGDEPADVVLVVVQRALDRVEHGFVRCEVDYPGDARGVGHVLGAGRVDSHDEVAVGLEEEAHGAAAVVEAVEVQEGRGGGVGAAVGLYEGVDVAQDALVGVAEVVDEDDWVC